jgi:hypothetical protein
MKQEFIGATSIEKSNRNINLFANTTDVDYFEESELQKIVDIVRTQGYNFEIDDCEACISGGDLEPINIPALADSTKEAIFLAINTFAKIKNDFKV